MLDQAVIVEKSASAVIVADARDRITLWNPMAEGLLGWSGEELTGRELGGTIFAQSAALLHDKGLSVASPGAAWRAQGDSCKRLETTARHKNGHRLPVELFIAEEKTQQGVFFIINAIDISERRQREKSADHTLKNQKVINAILKLSLKDVSLESLLTQAIELVTTLEDIKFLPKGAVLLVDEKPDTLLLKAHVGLSAKQVQACNQVSFGRCHCGRAARTGKIQFASCVDERHEIQVADSEPHGHYCVPIYSGGRVLGVMALYVREGHGMKSGEQDILVAITNILAGVIERKAMERQRVALVDKLHAAITAAWNEKLFTDSIIQSLNDGLIIIDPDGVITMINQVGRELIELFAVVPVEKGKRLCDIFDEKIAHALRDPNPPPAGGAEKEIVLKAKNREERVISYSTVPRKDASGQEVGFILTFRDTTEVKRARVEMEKMNHLVTVAEIASAVAHEVRNPLAGIKTMSQSIEENMPDDDENKEYLFRIIRQVDRLNELLTNFFTFAKPVMPRKRKISLIELVNETKQLVQDKLISKRIKLYESYAPGLNTIHADPNQVQQVLLNLMLNSIEAISNDGVIEIKANSLSRNEEVGHLYSLSPEYKKDCDYLKVYFRDNGCGMSKEVMERAFKPFFSTKPNGTGLGLSIVYRILKENSALIFLDPSVKSGTSIIMLFEM